MPLTKEDLYKNMYDYDTLKANIYCVSLMDILKTQKLNSDFCVKYILNPHFQLTQEEQKITLEIVKKYQPHITENDFIYSNVKVSNKKLFGLRIDSIDDFETYVKNVNK